LAEVLEKFNVALGKAKFIVGQNLGFDVNMGCGSIVWLLKVQ
jgi:DNA polymerase-3 subunit alpha